MESCTFPRGARRLALLSAVIYFARVCAAAVVTLAWDPSGDPNVASYRVYYGAVSGSYAAYVQVSAPATNAVISGLFSNTTYYFAATALDSAGSESSYSNETTAQVPAATVPPTA